MAYHSHVQPLARIYTNMIGTDHYKHQDGLFTIQHTYDVYKDKYSMYAVHNGYINAFCRPAKDLDDAKKEMELGIIDNIREILQRYNQHYEECGDVYPENMDDLIKEFNVICEKLNVK